MPSIEEAKDRLDLIINKGRVHLYKPIQIAEVLYHSRAGDAGIDVNRLDTYRSKSKHWRDDVCNKILGTSSTSSARYQDNIWEENAMTPEFLATLDFENKRTGGAIEKYIYLRFQEKQQTVSSIITIVDEATSQDFNVVSLFEIFRKNAGVKRSIDKVYEIVVYSLMETIVVELDAQVTVSVPESKNVLLSEFADLASILLGLSNGEMKHTVKAHVYRVGVTNAADRGLDMWANFGPAIQVKHLTLDAELAENIVDQIESDNIVIACRSVDRQLIQNLLSQTSWFRRVKGIVTEEDLAKWYERCLRGKYASVLASKLLERLSAEFKKEFPQSAAIVDFLEERKYLDVQSPERWGINLIQDLKSNTN